tara:strand:- start:182 stop:568 length:387 start_codon:yes stop_codon:yes gene_type:complete
MNGPLKKTLVGKILQRNPAKIAQRNKNRQARKDRVAKGGGTDVGNFLRALKADIEGVSGKQNSTPPSTTTSTTSSSSKPAPTMPKYNLLDDFVSYKDFVTYKDSGGSGDLEKIKEKKAEDDFIKKLYG